MDLFLAVECVGDITAIPVSLRSVNPSNALDTGSKR
jgi:hypothetical protein